MLQFKEGESFLHKTDPRVKLLWLIALTVFAILSRLEFAAVLFLLVILLYNLSGVSIFKVIGEEKILLLVILIPFLARVLFEKGTTGFLGFPIPSGAYNGILNSLYVFFIFFISMLFIFTTRVKEIEQALLFFRMPSDMVFMLVVAIGAVPLLQQKAKRVMIAQASRGGRDQIFSLIIPMLHSIFTRAKKLAISVETRGFDPESIHFRRELKMRKTDYGALCALLLFILTAPLLFC